LALPFARIVLDGEAVAHCPEGLPDFRRLQRAFTAFDLLHLGLDNLRPLELCERRALLRKHLRKALPALLFSEHVEGEEGEAMFRHACRLGLEGIVSKRATSRYKSGRCLSWVKVKNPGYERR
jgi:bifunctional non-homologous end joining protein LigD